MKIIKLGFDIKSWRLPATCNFCKSELEIEEPDLHYDGEKGNWHDTGWEEYTCYCAVCGYKLIIPSTTEIPNMVRSAAQKRKKK
jgi:hypothetical protein